MDTLTCPKCMAQMRQYERGGVVVDQCTECRGIFLDRGELEKLVDAEDKWEGRHREAPRQEQPRYEQPRYEQPRYEQPRYEQPRYEQQHYDPRYDQRGHGYPKHPHKKRRKSFFDELFDD